MENIKEYIVKTSLALCAFAAVVGLVLIFLFVGIKGFSIFRTVGPFKFLFGLDWSPTKGNYGILAPMLGSFIVTIGALILGAPLAIATAIFLAEIAPPSIRKIVRPTVELLAGIPSVVYGFFGIVILIPMVRRIFGGSGFGMITGCIILAIMIIPTITSISQDAIEAVPKKYTQGSLALGATRWQTIWHNILPAARPGLLSAIILGTGRAIGETMAVLMVLGNAPVLPKSISAPMSTLTSMIVLDMSYASGDHQVALFGMGIVLLIISMTFIGVIHLKYGNE